MFDLTKTFKPEQMEKQVADAVTKSKDIAVKAIDFNEIIFKESLNFFNDITDKFFYTYTLKAAEAVNQTSGYAKEFIQTGTVKALSTGGAKN